MKIISLFSILASVLVAVFGPQSSVGGPLTLLFISFIVMLVVGFYEAAVHKRGPFGALVNLITAVVGGFAPVMFVGAATETMLTLIHFQGSLARSHHPLLFVVAAANAAFTVLGSWVALQIINLLPMRRELKSSI